MKRYYIDRLTIDRLYMKYLWCTIECCITIRVFLLLLNSKYYSKTIIFSHGALYLQKSLIDTVVWDWGILAYTIFQFQEWFTQTQDSFLMLPELHGYFKTPIEYLFMMILYWPQKGMFSYIELDIVTVINWYDQIQWKCLTATRFVLWFIYFIVSCYWLLGFISLYDQPEAKVLMEW